jgi:hypothetical protein
MARPTLPRRKLKFPVGTRVIDRETNETGTVVHHFSDLTLSDVLVVRWGRDRNGIAVPVSSIRRYRTAPIAKRRRGGKS